MPIPTEITATTMLGRLHELDEIRQKRGELTRVEWLRRAGVSESAFYRWMNFEHPPKEAAVQRLAIELGVKIV